MLRQPRAPRGHVPSNAFSHSPVWFASCGKISVDYALRLALMMAYAVLPWTSPSFRARGRLNGQQNAARSGGHTFGMAWGRPHDLYVLQALCWRCALRSCARLLRRSCVCSFRRQGGERGGWWQCQWPFAGWRRRRGNSLIMEARAAWRLCGTRRLSRQSEELLQKHAFHDDRPSSATHVYQRGVSRIGVSCVSACPACRTEPFRFACMCWEATLAYTPYCFQALRRSEPLATIRERNAS